MPARVENHPYGFVVTEEGYENDRVRVPIAWGRDGSPVIFHGRPWAEAFAKTWDAGDTKANHDIAQKYGKRY